VIAAAALAVIMMQGQAPARDARPAPADGTATVTGVVVSADAQPRPLRRARVTINGAALAPGRTAITADDGTFAFGGLRAGRYLLTVTKDGYVPMTSGVLRPGPPAARVAVADGETQKVTLRVPRGAVITGVVLDADGQPSQGIAVTALVRRYVGTQGERRYLTAGTTASPTDDRGVYRIYGLPAGEYVVAAQPQNRQAGMIPGAEVRTISRGVVSERGVILSQVFYPAATDVARASRVMVAAGEERGGIDIQLQYVPLATVSGIAPAASGWNPASLTMVRTDEVPGFDPVRSARADTDGRFTFSGVTPGQYRLLARSTAASPLTTSGSPLIVPPGNTQVAFADVTVDGEDVTNVSLSLLSALTISGRIAFEGERPPPPLAELRVSVPITMTIANAGMAVPMLQLESAGTFKVEGVVPGLYRMFGNIQGLRAPIGAWWLKSLVVGGRDVLDAPLDLRQSVDDAVVTFTDRATELSGTMKDAQGNPAVDHFIVAFSTDRATWFFNSRRVAAVRPDAQGRYSIRNLPPGDYRVVSAELDQGDWFDPAVLERLLPSAAAITLTGIEKKTHDIVVR
jgi:carboxypeptidase family protein